MEEKLVAILNEMAEYLSIAQYIKLHTWASSSKYANEQWFNQH